MNHRIHVGVFDDQDAFLAAAKECAGNGLEVVDAFTPFPMHEIDHVMKLRRTRLPWVTLIGGLAGLTLGLWFQYWASAQDWAINVGGKPWDSLPAFIPVGFEMTVLLAGIATVVGVLGRSGLWPGKKPRRVIEGTTDDRFALLARHASDDLEWRSIKEIFERHGAVEQWEESA